jgi:hypothetical protein
VNALPVGATVRFRQNDPPRVIDGEIVPGVAQTSEIWVVMERRPGRLVNDRLYYDGRRFTRCRQGRYMLEQLANGRTATCHESEIEAT